MRICATQTELLCKARSLLLKKGEYVLVGDRVEVMNIDWRDARALVCAVRPRRSEIRSPKAANVDHFAVVFSIADPPFEAFQATRFLVSAASIGIKCSLVLNKCDLVSEAEVQAQLRRVAGWGYQAVAASVQSGLGMKEVRATWLYCLRLLPGTSKRWEQWKSCRRMQLREMLRNRTSVLAGPSGVGKSSIINYLRSVAFDDGQRARLEAFEAAMAEEREWRREWRGEPESEDDGVHTAFAEQHEGGGDDVAGASLEAPSEHGATNASPAQDEPADASAENVADARGGAAGTAACGVPGEQQRWKQNSSNIYGAQVRYVGAIWRAYPLHACVGPAAGRQADMRAMRTGGGQHRIQVATRPAHHAHGRAARHARGRPVARHAGVQLPRHAARHEPDRAALLPRDCGAPGAGQVPVCKLHARARAGMRCGGTVGAV